MSQSIKIIDCLKSTTKFKERYEQLVAAATASSQGSTPPRPSKKQKTQNLLHDDDSDDSDSDKISNNEASSTSPWLVEYEQYINTNDVIPNGMSIVAWWGVCYAP